MILLVVPITHWETVAHVISWTDRDICFLLFSVTIGGGSFKGFLVQTIDAGGATVGTFLVSQSCAQALICSGGVGP